MKKAKLMVLFYLLHAHFDVARRGKVSTYATLYVRLPLAQSTIRGIVQEFLYDQLIRRVYSEDADGFVLTGNGVEMCKELFIPLFVPHETEATLRIGQNAQGTAEKSLHIQLNAQTQYVFEHSNRLQHDRRILLLEASADQKVIVEYWFRLKAGRTHLALREKVVKLFQQLSRQKNATSPNSKNVRSLQKNIMTIIISALRSTEGVPEVYYPRDLRVTTFLQQLWHATV